MSKELTVEKTTQTTKSSQTTKNNIKYLHKYFSDYLKEEWESTISLKPTSKKEIGNIISPLNSNKAPGSNSILIE